VLSRAGSITEGTTVCDHDPAAVRQQRSVGLAVAPMVYEGIKINLVDTPGYADFVGELRAGLRAADAALFVVCAAEGIDPTTVALWQECAAVGMPRAVVIARLDHPRADVAGEMAACQAEFGAGVLPLYLPAPDGAPAWSACCPAATTTTPTATRPRPASHRSTMRTGSRRPATNSSRGSSPRARTRP